MRPIRIADRVADVLRDRILSGELPDNTMLPKQEDLVEEFEVSQPSLRDALRILESEGLITVRRGNVGGAVVHRPDGYSAAYTLALTLQGKRAPLGDIADALGELEPLCVRFCAADPNRRESIVPTLRGLVEDSRELIDEDVAFTKSGRAFHDALISLCPNRTLSVVTQSVQAVWSMQEEGWAERSARAGDYPPIDSRLLVIKTHSKLVDAIEAGNVNNAERVSRAHLTATQDNLRDQFAMPINGSSTEFQWRLKRLF